MAHAIVYLLKICYLNSVHSAQQIIDHWTAKLLANPQRFQEIGAIFKFVIEGPQGATWRLQCRPPVGVASGDGPADCTIALDELDFIELGNRRMNPQSAFLAGRIRLSGNVTLALRLGEIV